MLDRTERKLVQRLTDAIQELSAVLEKRKFKTYDLLCKHCSTLYVGIPPDRKCPNCGK